MFLKFSQNARVKKSVGAFFFVARIFLEKKPQHRCFVKNFAKFLNISVLQNTSRTCLSVSFNVLCHSYNRLKRNFHLKGYIGLNKKTCITSQKFSTYYPLGLFSIKVAMQMPILHIRSSRSGCSIKKGVHNFFCKIHRKTPVPESLF